ncbi:MAG: hypothetical protein NTY38_25355 [Acidobacteria bacterium]|nr:hypothetical protein [Acidobacteriota bacterium]
MVNAFRGLVEHERGHLAELLRQADNRLIPLSDPFRLPFSGHRWLDSEREREESYSDWLAWLLEQMGSAEQVLRVFGLEDSDFGRLVRDKNPVVSREYTFRPPGGEVKRLDIYVCFGDAGALLIEVKIRDLDEAGGSENLPIYGSWLEACWPDSKCRHAILLVPNSMELEFPGWEVLSWDHVSLQLRREAAACCSPSTPGKLLFAAMLLCFAGAVEQNLLGLSGAGTTTSAPQTALYLEKFLERNES